MPVPPTATTVADPGVPPLHAALVCDVIESETGASGSVIVAVAVDVHPFASIAVTVYEPAANPEVVALVSELLHT